MSVRGEQAARLCEFEKLESGGTAPKTGPLIGGVGSRRSRVKKGNGGLDDRLEKATKDPLTYRFRDWPCNAYYRVLHA